MNSLWNDSDAVPFAGDALGLRVYTSRLLGRDSSLVLHGGGNTSVKSAVRNIFGDLDDVLYVKGSGWDLATIERAGFAPVRMSVLLKLGEMEHISDSDLVRVQRSALTDPAAPDPSVEAVLHAIIPFAYVDHTHADAVVALTNAPDAAANVEAAFGDSVIVVPYVMPGFPLARAIRDRTRGLDWSRYRGMVLLSHGAFTWGETAQASYEAMIALVSRAEDYLRKRGALSSTRRSAAGPEDLTTLARVRRAVSDATGKPMLACLNASPEACGFAELPELGAVASRGPLTPDHIIRTKQVPVVLGADPVADVVAYVAAYGDYFRRRTSGALTMLDPAPRWGVWPSHGTLAFGRTVKDARIVEDISQHTAQAIQWAEALGGWRALPEEDLFAVEYWELEQAKLAKAGAGKPLDGRVAIVTGAASGIGKAIATELHAQGSAVVTVDVNDAGGASKPGVVHVVADVSDPATAKTVADRAVRAFGGVDILVSNVGVFPKSQTIAELDQAVWERTLDVNLSSHQRMLQACIPYLRVGIAPSVVLIGSKNVPAPGPGQAAYSVSKAGLTQLARVAALELATDGIRVNVIHPNAVFDTAIWTEATVQARAKAYGMTVDEYKRSNLLGVEVTSRTVALMVSAMAGPAFACTTGAQVPVDGGNDRVI